MNCPNSTYSVRCLLLCRLAEKVEKQAQEIASLQGYIRNTTQGGGPSPLDMADALEQQAALLHTLLGELRNSSRHIQARLEDPSPAYHGYTQGQGRDSGFLGSSGFGSRAGFEAEASSSSSSSSATRGPNLTVLVAAGLRLQVRRGLFSADCRRLQSVHSYSTVYCRR